MTLAGLALFLWAPATTWLALEAVLALFFLAWLVLRLSGAAVRPESRPPISAGADDELPIYTVIAALYREARGGRRIAARARRGSIIRPRSSTSCSPRSGRSRDARAPSTRARARVRRSVIVVPRRRAAHQAEGAQRRAAFRARHLHRRLRRRGPAGARPASPRAGRLRRRRRPARLRAGAADHRQHRRQLARRACSPPNMPACSTCSCRASRRCGCRCRSAARRTISAPPCCARSAAGTRTTSPRTPISACGSRASAIAPRSSLRPPTRKRRRGSALAAAAHALVQRLDADLARAHARAARGSGANSGSAGFCGLPALVGGTVLAALVHPLFAAQPIAWLR